MTAYTPSPDEVSFSVDVCNLVRAFLADPALRLEVGRAIKAGPATSMTEKLGYSNRAAAGEPPRWATLFPATQKGKHPGEPGLFWISKASQKPGEAPRPILRLRPQPPRDQQTGADPGARRIEAKLSQDEADEMAAARLFGISVEELRRARQMTASAVLVEPPVETASVQTDEDLRDVLTESE